MGIKASNFSDGKFIKPEGKKTTEKTWNGPSFEEIRKKVGPTVQEELPLEELRAERVKKLNKRKSSQYMDDMINSDQQ